MPSKIDTILDDVKNAIEAPFEKLGEANKIVASALKDEPGLQAAVVSLIAKVQQLAQDAAAAATADGLNFAADAVAVAQAKELYSYVTGTFIPDVQAAFKDIELAAQPNPAANAKPAQKKPPATIKSTSSPAASSAPPAADAPAVTQ